MLDYESMKSNPLAFVKRRTITSAYIDSTGRMGIAQTALMIQDNITGNFGEMDCDNFLINKLGAYWVLTRSRFHFYKRPFWREKVHTVSFPASNALVRANENTAIVTPEGEFLITANQEACCLDLKTHRPVKLTTLPCPGLHRQLREVHHRRQRIQGSLQREGVFAEHRHVAPHEQHRIHQACAQCTLCRRN